MSEQPLLSPEEIASVLTGGDGTTPGRPAEAEAPGPLPYSLREPFAIPPEGEAEARRGLEKVASELKETLSRLLASDIGLEFDAFQQQRAGAALAVLPAPAWILHFPGTAGGIAVVLHPALALGLVELALGGPGRTTDTVRTPTGLEERVLRRLGEALGASVGRALGVELAGSRLEIGRVPRSLAAETETVAVGLLRVRLPEGERSALLLARSSFLVRARKGVTPGPRPLGCLARGVDRIPVMIRAVVPAGRLSLADLSEVRPEAILMLDAPESTPIQLRAAGIPVCSGRIERRPEGTHFTVITRRGRKAPPTQEHS